MVKTLTTLPWRRWCVTVANFTLSEAELLWKTAIFMLYKNFVLYCTMNKF
jgi:hypothetical protein